jgi:hypothetical protein
MVPIHLTENKIGALEQSAVHLQAPTVIIVLLLVLASVLSALHHRKRTHGTKISNSWQDEAKWIALANILEAETLIGHGLPLRSDLFDVMSYEGIHEFHFIDWKSRESITVWFAASRSGMTVEQMMAIRNSFVSKSIAQQNASGSADLAVVSKTPHVIGQKRLKLSYGEIISADQILVPLVSGGAAKGLQVHLTMDGNVYHILTYGTLARERRFVDFLNQWRSASLMPRQSDRLTTQEKSIAYTKRATLLAQIAVRHLEAVECLQKAIQFDPKNSDARRQLQFLMTARNMRDRIGKK